MITIFNRRSLYIGYSKEKKDRIAALLDEHQIPYIVKEWNARHPLARGRGTVGQLKQYQTTYEIYVNKNDYSECNYLISLL